MRRLALTTLAALLALQALISPVAAAKPLIIDVDVTFVDEVLSAECGFTVTTTNTGMLVVFSKRGPGGTIVEATVGANFRVTFTGSSGTQLIQAVSGLQEFSFSETTLFFRFSGRAALIVVPGVGTVVRDVGRFELSLTLDPTTGEVISEESSFHGNFRGLSLEELCAFLV
jgi:hypothetical protein